MKQNCMTLVRRNSIKREQTLEEKNNNKYVAKEDTETKIISVINQIKIKKSVNKNSDSQFKERRKSYENSNEEL